MSLLAFLAYPTEFFTVLESQNPPMDVSEMYTTH